MGGLLLILFSKYMSWGGADDIITSPTPPSRTAGWFAVAVGIFFILIGGVVIYQGLTK